MIMINSNFISNFTNFCVAVNFFFTIAITILFPAVPKTAVVAKLLILGILFLSSFILALRSLS